MPFNRRQVFEAASISLNTLHEARNFVEHVDGLVLPAALPPGAGKDFIYRLPEAEWAIADRQFRRDLQSAPADVDQKLARIASA